MAPGAGLLPQGLILSGGTEGNARGYGVRGDQRGRPWGRAGVLEGGLG